MKLKLLLLCVLTQFVGLQAQTSAPTHLNPVNPGSVSGKVVDKKTNEPIPYATVTIKDGAKVISGAITKENGTFTVGNLELKDLTIEVLFMGYKKYESTFNLSSANKSLSLKTIALEEEATMLEGVSVVRERSSIEQKIDRKVITVGKDLVASGNTASEIFNNIPTVSIDPQTKELSLRGNSNVRVLIDGKPSNVDIAQLLQQIPSSSIKQIELITNPSAKYNPEGMSGIINIILHKNANIGFNGSINTGVTFGITPKTNTSLNMNYKVGKVNFYSNYGFNHGINANHGLVDSYRIDQENRQIFQFRNLDNSHLLKFGADYYINDKNTLSFYTNQSINHSDGSGKTTVDYARLINPNTVQLFGSESKSNSQTYDLAFKHNFDKKDEVLDFQVNFATTTDDEDTNYDDSARLSGGGLESDSKSRNIVDGVTNSTQINVDYTNPLTEKTKLELGAEMRIQDIKNNLIVSEAGDNYVVPFDHRLFSTNNFTFNRTISSGYANYSKEFNSKWSAQVGVRVEYYDIAGDFKIDETKFQSNVVPTNQVTIENIQVKDHIFTFYPSAFVTYAANEKNSFNFNYSRRVDRPSIGQISPIREWTTPLIKSVGNPELKPQFTNSFEVNYTRTTKLGSITAGVFYRRIGDEISRTISNNPDNINQKILSFNNFDDNNAYGVEASTNLRLAKWWSANMSTDAYFKTVRGTIQNPVSNQLENAEIDVVSFNARINNTITATSKLKFQVFAMYRGRDLSLQFARKEMYKGDIGLTYSVLKGKGTITTRFNDVFDTMRFSFEEVAGAAEKQNGAFYWESQSVYVGFNYVFGGGKNKALQRKQRDANETQGGGGMF